MCLSSLQKPALAAEVSPYRCGIDAFFAEKGQSGLFQLLRGILTRFCRLLFPGFSAPAYTGFDYLVKTLQMVKEKKLTFFRKLLS